MWRPDEVVPQYKKRAVALWVVLIGGIIAYTSWLLYQAVDKRKNPSTSYTLSNTVYLYPDTWVCLYNNYGCDRQDLEAECVATANITAGGESRAVFYPGGDDTYEQQHITVTPIQIEEQGECVEFKTSEITRFEGQERDAALYLDYVRLDMFWYPGGGLPSNSCVPEGTEWLPHSEWLYVFLHDPVKDIISTGIQTPYSCITNASNTHAFTYTGIGLTIDDKLHGETTTSYKALSSSTATHKDSVDPSITTPYAYLSMEIQQEPDSLEIIMEIDPLNVAEIFGNIGGFWDLLLILWPIFFVAATRQDPSLKPRNFRKSVAKGAGRAVGFAGVIALSEPSRRQKASGRTALDPRRSTNGGEQPYWGADSPASQPAV